MEQLNAIIANNLKTIRDAKKLSLDKVATMTGVSKSMLGQIERGESNPTITTVWKIANGLKVPFTTLVEAPKVDYKIVSKDQVNPVKEDNGKVCTYPLFPYREDQPYEIYMSTMEKGAYMEAASHGEGSYEVITVFKGEVTMTVNGEDLVVKAGAGLGFWADKVHIYHNTHDDVTEFNIVISYNEK